MAQDRATSTRTRLTRLARGGTADTYLRERELGDGRVERRCLKKIFSKLLGDPDFLKCLEREVAIGLTLRHSNIVSMLEGDVATGVLLFEFIDGVNLRQLIDLAPSHRLSAGLTVYIAMQLAQALEYAHSAGIIHRDVSARNVMISCAGEVKVLDFGVAKFVRRGREPETCVRGKMQYMAPEHARNDPNLDGRSDLFSLGVLCYELLAGRRPADSDRDLEIYNRHLHREYPHLRELVPDISPELADVVMRLLEPERDKRIPSAAACFDAFTRVAAPPGIHRELARLVRVALVQVTRERQNSEVIDEVPSAVQRSRGSRALKATAPPTPGALLLLDSERPTRANHAEPTTEAVRRTLGLRPRLVPVLVGAAAVVTATFAGLIFAESPSAIPNAQAESTPQAEREGVNLASTATQQRDVAGVVPDTSQRAAVERSETSKSDEPAEGAQVSATLEAPASTSAAATAPQPSSPPAAASRRQESGNGTLTVGVIPFSNVWIDGKLIGLSPVTVRVAAGTRLIGVGDKAPVRTRRVTVRDGDEREIFIDRSREK